MAIGTWEDFTDKYGFEDGATTDAVDFHARSHIVEALNTHPAMIAAKRTAIEWDRPGMHNGCMILVFPNPDSLSAADLLQKFITEPYVKQCELPDEVLEVLSETICDAYVEAEEDSDLAAKDNNLPPQIWIGIYHHRHGADYALWDHEPSEDEMLAYWKDEFEADRDDEYFDTYHPKLTFLESQP